jgi:hypothetical protein
LFVETFIKELSLAVVFLTRLPLDRGYVRTGCPEFVIAIH